jgi:hypothetical protein
MRCNIFRIYKKYLKAACTLTITNPQMDSSLYKISKATGIWIILKVSPTKDNQFSSNQGFSNNTYNGYPNNEYNNFNNQQFYGGPSFDNNQFSNNNSFSDFNIPDEFIIKEKLLTIGMDMKLLRDNQQFGYIKQKMFSLGRTF